MSVSATTDRPDVEAYLAAVRDELADLRPEERDDLLAEVEASILDSAEESDAPIAARLGPPADFAAELRAAAGLGGGPSAPKPVRRLLDAARRHPRAATLRRILSELAPIWWVARAYVLVAIVAWVDGAGRSITPPEIFRLGGPDLGLVFLGLALLVSIGFGLWQRRHGRVRSVNLALNLVLLTLAIPVYSELHSWLANRPAAFVSPDPIVLTGLAHDGVPVENVYPYSREGRLLLDVLLFDQNGLPLYVRPGTGRADDPQRRVLRTRNGAEVFNSYPIRYYETGTRRVARVYAGPVVAWSPIATPPLPGR